MMTLMARDALSIQARTHTNYPAPFAVRVQGRSKRALGDVFGLRQFGVNLTSLAPGAATALRHGHLLQDEFVYVLEGAPVLHTDGGVERLSAGMCIGMPAGTGKAYHLSNDSDGVVWLLEIGNRSAGDQVHYPDDDLSAQWREGRWQFTRKDGTPYEEESR